MYTYQDLDNFKFVEYCRKSTESDERQILSLESQSKENAINAKRREIKILDTISESASAKHPRKRDGFSKLLELIESKKFDALIVWNADRISRNSVDSGEIIYLMDLGLLKAVVTNNRVYLNNPEDKKQLQDQMTDAKYDNDRKSVDVKRGVRMKIEKGQYPGPAPQGYINVEYKITGERYIDIDEKRFKLLRSAMDLILYKGYTPKEALFTLNEEWGFTTRLTRKTGGKALSSTSWYRLLGDPFYYGYLKLSNGLENWGTHKPLITEDEYDRLQIILGRKGKPRITKHNYPYKKYLKCGACSGSVTAHEKVQVICTKCKTKFALAKGRESCTNCGMLIESMRKPKILRYVYYSCMNNKGAKCKEGSLRLKSFEDTVLEELAKIRISKDFLLWGLEHLDEVEVSEAETTTFTKENLTKKITDISTLLDDLLVLKARDKTGELITEEEYKSKRYKLIEERNTLTEKLEKLENNTQKEMTKETFDFARYAINRFKKGDTNTKETIVDKLSLNLTMKNRKLNIDKKKAYFVIEEVNEKEKEIRAELEPLVSAGVKTKGELDEALKTLWLGVRDSNPDSWDQNPESCH